MLLTYILARKPCSKRKPAVTEMLWFLCWKCNSLYSEVLLKQGFLANMYVKSIRHIYSLPVKLSNIIQFCPSFWEEVNLIIDSNPPEHFEDIIYSDLAIHNIILDKKNYSSPPLPPGSILFPTLKDIQQFRGI